MQPDRQATAVEKKNYAYGAVLTPDGVRYRSWFPEAKVVEVLVWRTTADVPYVLEFTREADGWHVVVDPLGEAGNEYVFRVDGDTTFCDPASRSVTAVGGRSIVCDSLVLAEEGGEWRRPEFRNLVFYELHVGTFSREGTFVAAIQHLKHLQELGINAIELMPVAEFPGARNWGYDGVLPYCVSGVYGGRAGLRKFVDAAHQHGIAVFLDVVYNHAGPDHTCYSGGLSHFFRHVETPWGRGFNFDGSHSGPVRQFFLENVGYWLDEFGIDGLRLDATHAIVDTSHVHIVSEMAREVHRRGRYVVCEDDRNLAAMAMFSGSGGMGMDGIWADDFHHSLRVSQTGERFGYYMDYKGTSEELSDVLSHGWLYRGQVSLFSGKPRGTECSLLSPSSFIHCISNHDQTGNRPFGDRITQGVGQESYRAMSAALCLTPYTPLLFMGQEWGASSPFIFFTDFDPVLGEAVTKGRRKEMATFGFATRDGGPEVIPDPQDPAVFLQSKLRWDELTCPPHSFLLNLYKECLQIRHRHAAFRPVNRANWWVWGRETLVCMHMQDLRREFLLIIALAGTYTGTVKELTAYLVPDDREWALEVSSNEIRFGGTGAGFDQESQSLVLMMSETLLLSRPGSP